MQWHAEGVLRQLKINAAGTLTIEIQMDADEVQRQRGLVELLSRTFGVGRPLVLGMDPGVTDSLPPVYRKFFEDLLGGDG